MLSRLPAPATLWLVPMLAMLFGFGCGPTAKSTRLKGEGVEFSGKLLGHDGRPMPMAHITIGEEVTQVGADGSFRLRVSRDAMLRPVFTGVDHATHRSQFLIERKPVALEVRLGTYQQKEVRGGVSVVQIHFRDKGKIKQGAVYPMLREADGVYRAAVAAKKGEFAYELRGLTADEGRTMNGSARTAFRYDGNGDYCNVVQAPGGMLLVEHDPRLALSSGVSAKLAFARPQSLTAQIAAVFDDANHGRSVAERLAEINDTPDGVLRHARSIALLASPAAKEEEHRGQLSALAKATLEALPAASLLWQAAPVSLVNVLDLAGPAYSHRGPELVRHIAKQGEVDIAANLALRFLIRAARSDDEEDLKGYYQLIQSEMPKTTVGKLSHLFHPERRIRLGKFLPQFELESADDDRVFTNASFRGKVLLIDFWATWCRPCLDELPNLHKTYAELGDQGFEILSINIDDKAGRSQAMRKRGTFPMPWSNVVVHRRDAATLKRRFEIGGLPTMILVDVNGKILATDVFTRGRALATRVRAALESHKTPPSPTAK